MHREIDLLLDLALFSKIIQHGGISNCARAMQFERTTVSRRLARLEKRLGSRLFYRNSKTMTVTVAGRECFDACKELLEIPDKVLQVLDESGQLSEPQNLFLAAPPDIVSEFIFPMLESFYERNQGSTIDCLPQVVWPSSSEKTYDLVIVWEQDQHSVNVVNWTRIATADQSLFASPSYLLRHPVIRSPFALESHSCIVERQGKYLNHWRFDWRHAEATIPIPCQISVSSLLEARETALAGLGVCLLPDYFCSSHVENGSLVRLLPDGSVPRRSLLVGATRRARPRARTMLLKYHLERAFGDRILRMTAKNYPHNTSAAKVPGLTLVQ